MENASISGQIRDARKRSGLTQQELANETGLSLRTVQRIEKGDQGMSGYTLRKISSALNVPLEQFLIPHVSQVRIESLSASAVKALYLSSLFFFINPLLGIVVPAILGYMKTNQDPFYKRHLRFIITYFIVFNIVVYGFAGMLLVPGFLQSIGTEEIRFEAFRYGIAFFLGTYAITFLIMAYRFVKLKDADLRD